MSALNPILVAIERSATENQGDAGAGWVFFVSTIGSVFGVIVAAFCLISYFSNQLSMLMIAATLGILTLGGVTVHRNLPRRLTRDRLRVGWVGRDRFRHHCRVSHRRESEPNRRRSHLDVLDRRRQISIRIRVFESR